MGTPGRVLDHIEKGTLALDRLQYLVIDEADEMLNMGFIDQVEAIIEELPTDRMTMLFSATLPEDVEKLSHKYMETPMNIEIKATGITTDKIEHALLEVREEAKFSLLKDVTTVENQIAVLSFAGRKNKWIMCLDN